MPYELKQSDIFDLAHSIGADVKQKGDELFFKRCPYCNGDGHDNDTFSINLVNGTFNCFRSSCGQHGHFVQMAKHFGMRLDFQDEHASKEYKKLPQHPIEVRQPAIDYMERRGISRKITERYQITTQKGNGNILVFPFCDGDGVLRHVKYRKADFDKSRDKNKEWCEADTMPILFGMKQCVDFGTLVITEGQIDSLSLAESGVKNPVSVPNGARGFTWVENCWDWINKFSEIVVFGDCENGKVTLVDELSKRLSKPLRVVRVEDYFGEKDANELLRKFGPDVVKAAVENSAVIPVSHIKELADVKAVDIYSLPKIRTGISEIDRIIGGMFRGQVILLTGKRGGGKSTFMSQVIVDALDQGEKVLAYSGELVDYHFRRWIDLQAAGPDNIETKVDEYGEERAYLTDDIASKIERWYRGRAYLYDNNALDGDDEFDGLLKTIELAVCRYGIGMVCIDNLMTAMDVDAKDDLYRAQSNFVHALKKLAVRHNIVVVLVAHPRKSKDGFSNDDVSGSSDITNRVDVVMNYSRSENEQWDSMVEITKSRLIGKLAFKDEAPKLFYSNSTKRITSESSYGKHYGWERIIEDANGCLRELPF